MLLRPTFPLLQEREGITTFLPASEPDLACSAQMVNHEKDLVPREVGALARHVFQVAHAGVQHQVDHLIFCGDLLIHLPPFEERNEVLPG